MKSKEIKRLITLASLTAIAVIISVVDKLISTIAFPFLPMAKIGLANVVVLFSLYKYKFTDSLIIVILKSIITGLLFGSLMTFVIGFSGTILSFFGMLCLKKILKEKVSVVGVSILGGMLHIIGQCIVIYFIYQLGSEISLYMGWLILMSLVTSLLVGLISNKMIGYNNIK